MSYFQKAIRFITSTQQVRNFNVTMYKLCNDMKIISHVRSIPNVEYYEKNVFDLFPKVETLYFRCNSRLN